METASRRPVDPPRTGRARVASAATPAVPGGRGAAEADAQQRLAKAEAALNAARETGR